MAHEEEDVTCDERKVEIFPICLHLAHWNLEVTDNYNSVAQRGGETGHLADGEMLMEVGLRLSTQVLALQWHLLLQWRQGLT